MTISSLMVHTVTVLTAGTTTDRYGSTVKDWSTATETTSLAWVAQRKREEVTAQGREAFVSEWVAFLPAETDIHSGDRLEWEAITFEVDGPPNPAWTPRGEHHIEASLRVVTG